MPVSWKRKIIKQERGLIMQNRAEDKLLIGSRAFNSRFILGSGKYSLELIKAAVERAGAEIITDRKSTRLNSSH